MLVPRCTLQISFLSTPSGWRATVVHPHHDTSAGISIHALRVEGDIAGGEFPTLLSGISIHALRVEGDIKALITSPSPGPFLSTPSGWRATHQHKNNTKTHTFLSTPSGWRATVKSFRRSITTSNFYPRPPGGGRPARLYGGIIISRISIHALRVEGDFLRRRLRPLAAISIHALRVEGDAVSTP